MPVVVVLLLLDCLQPSSSSLVLWASVAPRRSCDTSSSQSVHQGRTNRLARAARATLRSSLPGTMSHALAYRSGAGRLGHAGVRRIVGFSGACAAGAASRVLTSSARIHLRCSRASALLGPFRSDGHPDAGAFLSSSSGSGGSKPESSAMRHRSRGQSFRGHGCTCATGKPWRSISSSVGVMRRSSASAQHCCSRFGLAMTHRGAFRPLPPSKRSHSIAWTSE
mmetsp:Transcript_25531/g.45296  ORF Transcript_25531/g.45296 Transcript_25531/m.45296 type:complete len:223 (+) Transcript_25531:207-875(+)